MSNYVKATICYVPFMAFMMLLSIAFGIVQSFEFVKNSHKDYWKTSGIFI